MGVIAFRTSEGATFRTDQELEEFNAQMASVAFVEADDRMRSGKSVYVNTRLIVCWWTEE